MAVSLENREKRERERRDIVEKAVQAADRIILDGSDGTNEETDYLTMQVAVEFMNKIDGRLTSVMNRKDLLGDIR